MPRYKVVWKETYSATVEAEDEEEAVFRAIEEVNPAVSYRRAELESCVELEGKENAEV